uniref:Uncharacterized protein n=1 Tax=Clytia hemisphaerica TaxID=252671 RepID=A0A7M5WLR6_9CNID
FSCDKPTITLLKSTENIFKMKLSTTGIIFTVLLFTCMEVTNAGTLYQNYEGYKLGYGCHKGYCWAYCDNSWVHGNRDGKWCYTRQQGFYVGKVSCSSYWSCSNKFFKCVGACGN